MKVLCSAFGRYPMLVGFLVVLFLAGVLSLFSLDVWSSFLGCLGFLFVLGVVFDFLFFILDVVFWLWRRFKA